MRRIKPVVIGRLDAAIHLVREKRLTKTINPRVKPGGDAYRMVVVPRPEARAIEALACGPVLEEGPVAAVRLRAPGPGVAGPSVVVVEAAGEEVKEARLRLRSCHALGGRPFPWFPCW